MRAACWQRDPSKRPAFTAILQQIELIEQEGLPRVEVSGQHIHPRDSLARVRRPQLDGTNAAVYVKRNRVYAFRSDDEIVVQKSWGTGRSAVRDGLGDRGRVRGMR
jgi:hypothetical protein